jgi:hypothetical protein
LTDRVWRDIPSTAPAIQHALRLLHSRGHRVLEVVEVYSAGHRAADVIYGVPHDTVLWRDRSGHPMTSVVVVDSWDGESDEAQQLKLSTREGWD